MIIVNFSTRQYISGQQRLASSIKGYPILLFQDYKAIGSPTHQDSPYQFKVHSIEKAFEKDDIVLWCDSSMVIKGDLSIIEAIIKTDGYFMEEAGHYVKDWCQESTLNYFGLNRSSKYIMFSAGLLGLNKNNPVAMEWFARWKKSALDGHFKGEWRNHRHDMTCGSIIAQEMGLKYQSGGTYMSYIGPGYSQPKESVIIHCVGL